MILLFALLLATEQAPASPEPLIADCDAHQFQTIAHVMVDGKPHSSKVKLCGKTGQSDADWLRTLRDAIDKVEANESMSVEAKNQVIGALKVEIARLTPVVDTSPPPASPLPPPPPFLSPPVGGPVEYSALPPLPAPKPLASTAVIAASTPPPLPAPRLTLHCLAMNTVSVEGPCDSLERNMVLMVRADENVAQGTSLRFSRRGDNRAEVALPPLQRGQTRRIALPANVCKGVAASRVEIQVVRATGSTTQVVDTRGPYDLRC